MDKKNQSKNQKDSAKKSTRRVGRPAKDWKAVNASIPMDPEEFAKKLLNTPPQSIKKR